MKPDQNNQRPGQTSGQSSSYSNPTTSPNTNPNQKGPTPTTKGGPQQNKMGGGQGGGNLNPGRPDQSKK